MAKEIRVVYSYELLIEDQFVYCNIHVDEQAWGEPSVKEGTRQYATARIKGAVERKYPSHKFDPEKVKFSIPDDGKSQLGGAL